VTRIIMANVIAADDARTLGQPAVMVSDAFLSFMYMRAELREFSQLYHSLAHKAINVNSETPDKELYEVYRGQSVFFLENFICRISDFFDLYIEHLIYEVCLVNYSFLPESAYASAKKRLAKFVASEPSDDDIMFEAAITFGRKFKSEIASHFETAIGFSIEQFAPSWSDAVFVGKIRNVIVHKASKMDERFVDYAKNCNCPFELEPGKPLLMPEKWLLKMAASTDECIYAIDEKISDFMPVHKRNRYGHIWIPRSTWASPLASLAEKTAIS
jgi:hypothetical protein